MCTYVTVAKVVHATRASNTADSRANERLLSAQIIGKEITDFIGMEPKEVQTSWAARPSRVEPISYPVPSDLP